MQRILLVGLGFMGARHAEVYRLLPDATVVGVVDSRAEGIGETLRSCGLTGAPVFSDFDEALARTDCSVVDLCLPTDLHRQTSLRAFASGKHVFCEKPIALSREDARSMTDAARLSRLQLMVGHCIRFWPEYLELKRLVDSGENGRLLSLSMSRRTGRPGYSIDDWVNKPERCLGAALDLHIHDTDFLLHLLGSPSAVFSRGIRDVTGWSSLSTQYVYERTIVSADGAWNYPENWGFQMRFTAVFEDGVLDFDSRSERTLTSCNHAASEVARLQTANTASADSDEISSLAGYYNELAYFVDCLERGNPVAISSGEQAAESLDLLLAEIESADRGELISFNRR